VRHATRGRLRSIAGANVGRESCITILSVRRRNPNLSAEGLPWLRIEFCDTSCCCLSAGPCVSDLLTGGAVLGTSAPALTGLPQSAITTLCAPLNTCRTCPRNIVDLCAGVEMEYFDGMELATRLSMEAKEYWVHLDAEGPLEKYPGQSRHQCGVRPLISSCSKTTCSSCAGKAGYR